MLELVAALALADATSDFTPFQKECLRSGGAASAVAVNTWPRYPSIIVYEGPEALITVSARTDSGAHIGLQEQQVVPTWTRSLANGNAVTFQRAGPIWLMYYGASGSTAKIEYCVVVRPKLP